MNLKAKVSKIVEDLGGTIDSTEPINKQLNSLALVELIIRLEETFNFEISPIEYDQKQFISIDSITLMVSNKIES